LCTGKKAHDEIVYYVCNTPDPQQLQKLQKSWVVTNDCSNVSGSLLIPFKHEQSI
jgi:hypothetical protein